LVTDVTMATDVTKVTKIPHRQLVGIQTLTANWGRGPSNSRNKKGVITFYKASEGLRKSENKDRDKDTRQRENKESDKNNERHTRGN